MLEHGIEWEQKGEQREHLSVLEYKREKRQEELTEQIQQTEAEISERLAKLPDILKKDGYPDVQVFMRTFREMESVVEQFNRDLAAWEQQVREKQKPAKKEQAKPPERESVLKRLRQLQAEGKQRNQPRQRKEIL